MSGKAKQELYVLARRIPAVFVRLPACSTVLFRLLREGCARAGTTSLPVLRRLPRVVGSSPPVPGATPGPSCSGSGMAEPLSDRSAPASAPTRLEMEIDGGYFYSCYTGGGTVAVFRFRRRVTGETRAPWSMIFLWPSPLWRIPVSEIYRQCFGSWWGFSSLAAPDHVALVATP